MNDKSHGIPPQSDLQRAYERGVISSVTGQAQLPACHMNEASAEMLYQWEIGLPIQFSVRIDMMLGAFKMMQNMQAGMLSMKEAFENLAKAMGRMPRYIDFVNPDYKPPERD